MWKHLENTIMVKFNKYGSKKKAIWHENSEYNTAMEYVIEVEEKEDTVHTK